MIAAHNQAYPLAALAEIEILAHLITREGQTYSAHVQYKISGSLGTHTQSGTRHIRIDYSENGIPTGEAEFEDTSF